MEAHKRTLGCRRSISSAGAFTGNMRCRTWSGIRCIERRLLLKRSICHKKGKNKDGPCQADVPWAQPTDGRKHPRHLSGITRLAFNFSQILVNVKENV